MAFSILLGAALALPAESPDSALRPQSPHHVARSTVDQSHRRLRHQRHARDEIDWPEGKLVYSQQERMKVEERKSRQELHRLQYLESKKQPTLYAAAHREGNSKKDRQKMS